jgi:hypothetical protein
MRLSLCSSTKRPFKTIEEYCEARYLFTECNAEPAGDCDPGETCMNNVCGGKIRHQLYL